MKGSLLRQEVSKKSTQNSHS